MNKQNVRNLYCSVCGNIVPCTKTKKRTVDAYCIYCGKKQKLIDRKSMEPKSQNEFEMPRTSYNNRKYNNYSGNRNNNRNNRGYENKNYNGKNKFNNRGDKKYEDKDK